MNTRFLKVNVLTIYYALMLIVSFLLMRPGVSIPTPLRFALMILSFIPCILNIKLSPFVFLCFNGISLASFAQIFPTTPVYTLCIAIVLFIIHKKSSVFSLTCLVLFLYFLLCEICHLCFSHAFLIWIPSCILISDIITNKKDLQTLFYAFLIITIFISILYLLNKDNFIEYYSGKELGIEKTGWTNANFFGAAISAGGVLSMAYLCDMLDFTKNRILTFSCSIVVVLTIYILVLNASRGALLGFSIPSVLMLLLSDMKKQYKLLIITTLSIVVIFIISSGAFELLSHRVQEDTLQTGGGRTTIWTLKMQEFLLDSNPLHLLFGIGLDATNQIAENISTHNDILTSFIGYGIVGFFIFIFSIFYYPFKMATGRHRLTVTLLLIYVLIECAVLEPFFRGYIIPIFFYFFILKYALIMREDKI